MAGKGRIVEYTDKELAELVNREGTGPDWKKAGRMTQAEVEAQAAADPDETDMVVDWEKATVEMPRLPKAVLNMRIDRDVLDWFRRQAGYQTRINAILRAYMKAHKDH